MSLLPKLIVAGIVIGGGAYFYDTSTAKTKLQDATVTLVEADDLRCTRQHEGMCKYHATVVIKKEKLQYKFRIPYQFYHMNEKLKPKDRIPVVVKQKMIFPARILGLAPKLQAKIDKMISEDKM